MSDTRSSRPPRRSRRLLGAVLGGVAVVGLVALVAFAFLGGDLPGSERTATGEDDPVEEAETGAGDDAATDQDGFGDQAGIEGEPTPSTEFEMFDGSTATLADWEGQPLVLNFWASWCPPCVAEMSNAFEPSHQEHADEVAFLGANVQDDRDLAMDVVERTGVTYDLAEDPDGELFTEFGSFGMPTTVFVTADGRVVDTHGGPLTREQLESKIDELLRADA